jgi:drug/metabolite transporter (DMT)-like permease
VVYPVGVVAALCLAVGYVLQQRAAATVPIAEILHWRLLLDLLRRRTWLAGLGFGVLGQLLAAWALSLAGLAVVEPLLSTNLLFAFAVAARLGRHRVRPPEIVGAVLVSAALGGFLVAADPKPRPAPEAARSSVVLALVATVAVVVVLTAIARRRGGRTEAVLLSAGAGILLGLQDAATRQALLGEWTHAFHSWWSLVVIGAAAVAILLLQSAFRVADLNWSLPPLVAAEPIAGIALGVSVLGDRVSSDAVSVLGQSLCLAGMVAGVVLVARSEAITSLRHPPPEAPG